MLVRFPGAVLVLLSAIGCREPPDPPSQKSVEAAWQRADAAIHEAERARQDSKHAMRLRDIDRYRADAHLTEVNGQRATLISVGVGLSLCLLIAMTWLASEIRRRQITAAAIEAVATDRKNQHQIDHDSHEFKTSSFPHNPTKRR